LFRGLAFRGLVLFRGMAFRGLAFRGLALFRGLASFPPPLMIPVFFLRMLQKGYWDHESARHR